MSNDDVREIGMQFKDRIYELVQRIPPGKVLTYGRVASLLNVPLGARAVGWAMRELPSGSKVPWQRVINASGGISTHYLDSDGKVLQQKLLEDEGVRFNESGHVKLEGPDGVMWQPSPWEIRDIVDPGADSEDKPG
jgi:methylated-DNA-protein-cysteine methyltransferase related protein